MRRCLPYRLNQRSVISFKIRELRMFVRSSFFHIFALMIQDFRLQVFMAVARERNFTRAAKSLGVSQPAVSQNIAELEKNVGVQLFERERGDVSLTEKGRTFMMFAERIIKDYEDLNAVFADYEAFADLMEQARSISDNPMSYLVRDILYR